MDSRVKLYIERAENEFRLAKAVFNLSKNEKVKIELEANPDDTFYSAVISHSYYSIFYSAKAILLSKGIKTEAPEEHKKTFFAFKETFVDTGLLDKELLRIYDDIIVKADELLRLFAHEKWKRGHFTYKTISQANVEPAQESINNTIKFLANIKAVIEKQDAEEKRRKEEEERKQAEEEKRKKDEEMRKRIEVRKSKENKEKSPADSCKIRQGKEKKEGKKEMQDEKDKRK